MKRRTAQTDRLQAFTVYGAEWCEETTFVRRLLTRWRVKHSFVDIDKEPAARRKIMIWGLGNVRVPVITVGALELHRTTASTEGEIRRLVREFRFERIGPLLV